jgi:hypothetical protein
MVFWAQKENNFRFRIIYTAKQFATKGGIKIFHDKQET